MRAKRTVALALAGILSMASLAACSSSNSGANGSKSSTSVLNVGMPNGPQTENNNPFVNTSAARQSGYMRAIYEPLVMYNEVKTSDNTKPWLATKWEWSDNYRKLVFTIRDNVKWSDGQPLTADDVAYTFQLLRDNPGLNIDSVKYKDISASGNQVTLGFDGSQFVYQKKILEQIIVPKHQWSTFGAPATETVKNPIGSGPFTLKSFTPQTATLVAREGYWQEAPAVKEIRYTSYNDNQAQTTALATGQAEWSFVFIPNPQAVYTSKDPKNYKLWFPGVLGIHGLIFNTKIKPWDNKYLRRAVNMVVNRDDIFTQGEAGYFYPKVDNITGIPTPNGDPFIAPEFKDKKTAIDVAGAKKLLTDNGFTYQGDKLVDPAGQPVTLKTIVPSGWSDYVTNLEIIKDNLKGLGIDSTVDKINQDAWGKAIDTGDFQATLHWTNNGITPYDIYQSIMDGALYKPIGQGGINGNYGRYENPAATAALNSFANAADEASRTTAMNELQKIFVDEMPAVIHSAASVGGQYSTKNWVGWPDEQNSYAPLQPTQENALDIIMRLKPAGS
ncbi:ABC transporter substrate-binding protein [Kibdelosporangium phytohabitans]|uniref:Peptide ABC transporter substrate-binding protein n=1 Tax=Kibdelosporangium phytohabitans TaxID=860235 RepID=A0A0N9ID77_9PSEU|nr:ABC transporter substrate-binding protein [Kibdelosporangium phytohabitans]ALG12608.1 peptide ABC transporter substrate-binding protein [Kibdelosporangium phytohabitans]MBE1464243.1 peptide/nickel transport system substrate-binding protein [Kibdelosporangium phytohabitans]